MHRNQKYLRCSFCHKEQSQNLITSEQANICDECVNQCNQMVAQREGFSRSDPKIIIQYSLSKVPNPTWRTEFWKLWKQARLDEGVAPNLTFDNRKAILICSMSDSYHYQIEIFKAANAINKFSGEKLRIQINKTETRKVKGKYPASNFDRVLFNLVFQVLVSRGDNLTLLARMPSRPSDWIAIGKDMPGDGERVLVWIGDKFNDFDVARYNSKQKLWLIEGIWTGESDSITHWAPIVQPSINDLRK
jgi:hypothetical protein